jgi:riboflavin kinase/FMN adenylyltransferase
VVEGAKRGHTIGFPTANVAVDPEKLLPANGVYAVWLHVDGQSYPAVANIGVRPTFEETIKTIEVHIFDFDRNIYGQAVRVDLVEHLRPEQKFSGLEALVTQIGLDAQRAREILAAEPKPAYQG